MELKFDAKLDYQIDAINSVCDLFKGLCKSDISEPCTDMEEINFVVANKLDISNEDILENLKKVQKDNDLLESNVLKELVFNIEMETGTGKTYVYLRTILELNKQYGLNKFIIIVPNVAIKQGVNKTIEITKGHFENIYKGTPINHFIYDGSNLSNINSFATSNDIEIMIINIDSFNKAEKDKKSNIIYKPYDKLNGEKPIDLISSTNPFIIIDEPQSTVNTNTAKEAIRKLNPICTLKYSATHKDIENLVYKLDSFDAYKKKLVKQIEVLGIESSDNYNNQYIKLISVDNKKSPITAKIELYCHSDKGVSTKTKTVKKGDDLSSKKFANSASYKGYIVEDIDCNPGEECIKINGNDISNCISIGNNIGSNDEALKQYQIKKTIEAHLDKELALFGEGIKVLSLFFIDKVSNFQILGENNIKQKGEYAKIFEKSYSELLTDPKYEKLNLDTNNIDNIYGGYFSGDKKSLKDTEGKSKSDDSTYNLIMKDKEKLLSLDTKLRFIFTHSALREGWDNPNVFQICTLNQTQSTIKKRQEIGRGMRLCVNQKGDRIHDTDINKITIIANESYKTFADTLQKEYEEDGFKFNVKQIIKNAKDKKKINIIENVYISNEFKDLWNRIKYKTTYSVSFKTDALIEKCKESLKGLNIAAPNIKATKASIKMDKEDGINIQSVEYLAGETISYNGALPDILSDLQEKTKLTRKTIGKILIESNTLDKFKINPEAYIFECEKIINQEKREIITDGIVYTKISDEEYYSMELFKTHELHTYLNEGKNLKSIYDYIICDSKNEQIFAKKFEETTNIKLYIKLPSWFKIPTPLGSYNPDWAILIEIEKIEKIKKTEKLYFVLETKGNAEKENLRPIETNKIKCGKAHFEALKNNAKPEDGVKFQAVDNFDKFMKDAIKKI